MVVSSLVISQDSVEKDVLLEAAAVALDEDIVEPITLEEAKHHLNVVYDDDNDYISSLIVAARRMTEGKLNRTITQRVLESAFSSWGRMPLRKPPFVQIESVSYFDVDGNERTLDPDQITVSTRREPACVELSPLFRPYAPSLYPMDEAVVVRYTAGYPVGQVPQDIIHWMKLQIGSMYEHRESVIAGVSVSPLPEMYEKMFLQPYMVYE